MDFTNQNFVNELNMVRKRIIPSPISQGSISQDSIEITPITKTQSETDYINLDTFKCSSSNTDPNEIDNHVNQSSQIYTNINNRETNIDTLSNFNLQRTFEKLNRTLEENNNVLAENKSMCFQTATIMILSGVYIIGVLILNDYILLTYFINRD